MAVSIEGNLSVSASDPGGDELIDLNAYTMSGAEVTRLAGVSARSLINWRVRNIMHLGSTGPDGMISYSVADAVRLAAAGCLAQHSMAPLDVAALLAEEIARYCLTRPPAPPGGPRPNRNLVLAWGQFGPLFSWVDTTGRPGMTRQYPPRHDDDDRTSLRQPYIVIPADAIIDDVILRTEHLQVAPAAAEAVA